MSNNKLQDWKDAHCNDDSIYMDHKGVCHSVKHPEVTFGYCNRCDGCPYST